ncbi:ATP-binding protein [Paenibacillus abyssi]|uniref:histidine kinase n=1 Tax=Paenibacillus abyssi TaxID=1340531 RepID=A0A917LHI9_9BACL|nr:ATP-binding protein [Paenibacillus abyssi]GGG24323.1 hypothetical protein GCM10010916_46050 [Paenibacillus abyssi]
MLKETLLQVMIALLPVVAFQMWLDRPTRHKGIPLFLGTLCGVSMIMCMLMSTETIYGYDLDYRLIPYIIGSLYGGVPVAVVLTILYVAVRINMLDGVWEQVGFIVYLILVVPVLLLSIRYFERASRKGKQRMAIGLAIVILQLFFLTYIATLVQHDASMGIQVPIFLAVMAVIFLCVMWSAVFIIESVKEKQQLQHQLQRMSLNYRNEVQKLQQFIDVTPLGVIIVDRKGDITHLNDMAMRIMGDKITKTSRLDLIGQPFTELYESVIHETSGRLIADALNGHNSTSEMEHEDNKIYIRTGFTVRDMHNQKIIGAALIVHDITELTRLRDEVGRMERLSLVGQMAASITHEIRNPMAVIRGFVQLMQERSPENQREYYHIVMEELDRANGIINDFLSLAQNRIVDKEKSSLNAIINELAPLLWADANLRGQSVELELEPSLASFDMNAKEIKQLILNLARNAMEAMGDKGLLVIRTKQIDNVIELQVSDTGCGIPQEQLDHLFEPFYTTKTSGTGLGLALCLSIVEQHLGKIEVTSKEDVGTTFVVTFTVT